MRSEYETQEEQLKRETEARKRQLKKEKEELELKTELAAASDRMVSTHKMSSFMEEGAAKWEAAAKLNLQIEEFSSEQNNID